MKVDVEIMQDFGSVKVYEFGEIKKAWSLFNFVRQFFHLIFHRYDVYYCYFVDYHALLPVVWAKLMRRKSVVVVAGYDAMGIKTSVMTYGIFNSKWRGWIARRIYAWTDHVFLVSQGLVKQLRKNGIDIDDRFQVVYMGFNIYNFRTENKSHYCFMIGVGSTDTEFYRKGYDRFIALAEKLPAYTFYCIGLDKSRKGIPFNVIVLDPMPNDQVIDLMSRAKVYLQPSRAEGWGTAITEALLCGCTVVSSEVDGIPENNVRFTFDEYGWDNNIQFIADTIEQVMQDMRPNYSNMEFARRLTILRRKHEIDRIIWKNLR